MDNGVVGIERERRVDDLCDKGVCYNCWRGENQAESNMEMCVGKHGKSIVVTAVKELSITKAEVTISLTPPLLPIIKIYPLHEVYRLGCSVLLVKLLYTIPVPLMPSPALSIKIPGASIK